VCVAWSLQFSQQLCIKPKSDRALAPLETKRNRSNHTFRLSISGQTAIRLGDALAFQIRLSGRVWKSSEFLALNH
jgi:hypothetical protein